MGLVNNYFIPLCFHGYNGAGVEINFGLGGGGGAQGVTNIISAIIKTYINRLKLVGSVNYAAACVS